MFKFEYCRSKVAEVKVQIWSKSKDSKTRGNGEVQHVATEYVADAADRWGKDLPILPTSLQ